MRDMPISRIMTTDPVTIGPDQPVHDARRIFDSRDLNHLPVVEDEILVGMLSASDMLKFFMLDRDAAALDSIVVRQVMQPQPVVLPSDANLRDAANRLRSGGFHALPVVDPDHVLVGIVTSSDLIEHLLRQLPTGDGSIEATGAAPRVQEQGSTDASAIVAALERKAANGEELGESEKALIALNVRAKRLEAICEAAERYVRSGHADHEHSVLVKRLDAVRSSARKLDI